MSATQTLERARTAAQADARRVAATFARAARRTAEPCT